MFSRKNNKKRNTSICFCTQKPNTKLANGEAVGSLPDDWKPRHAGVIFTTYINDQEKAYENLTIEMKNEAKNLNNKIDIQLRKLIQNLMEDVREYELNISKETEQKNSFDLSLNIDIYNEKVKELKMLRLSHYDEITKFKQEALELEQQRSEFLKKFISKYLRRFIYLGYHSINETEHEFNTFIQEINQQMVSNECSLNNLELKLQKDTTRLHMHGLLLLKQKKYEASIELTNKESDDIVSQDEISIEEKSFDNESVSEINFLHKELVDDCFSVMIKIYRVAVIEIFNGFYKKLRVLNEGIEGSQLGNVKDDSALMELDKMIEEAAQNLENQIIQEFRLLEEIRVFGIELQKSLHKIGNEVREAHLMLHEALELFEQNMMRVNLIQRQTIAAVDDLLSIQDSIEITSEVGFNIAIENLRQSSDIDKLQLLYETAMGNLQIIGDLYSLHKNAVIGKLEDCLRLIPIMSDAVLADLEFYLEKYPRGVVDSEINSHLESLPSRPELSGLLGEEECAGEIDFSPNLVIEGEHQYGEELAETEEESIQSEITCVPTKLADAFSYTKEHLKALRQWRNDFLDSIESNTTLLPDELLLQSQHWVDEKAMYLNTRYFIKIASHSVRIERVKAVLNLRRAELEYHAKRLKEHSLAIQKAIEDFDRESANCLSLESPELYPFMYWAGDIENRVNGLITDESSETVKSLKKHSYLMRLEKCQRSFNNSIEPVVENIREGFLQKIQKVRISNSAFMSGILMFSEGGRYSAKEAESAMNILARNSEALETCASRVLENINHIPSQLREEADNYVAYIRENLGYNPSKRDGKRIQSPKK